MHKTDYETFHATTVRIPCLNQTGFWINHQVIFTCTHGCEIPHKKGDKLKIVHGESTIPVEVIRFDADNDILLLRAMNELDPLVSLIPLSEDVMPGDKLYSWGYTSRNPIGGESVRIEMEGWSRAPYLLKLSKGMVEPGMSGSPLYSYRTKTIVGMIRVTRDRNAPSGGRAVPPSIIMEVCKQEKLFSTPITDPSVVLQEDIPTILGMFESAYDSTKPLLPVEKELFMRNYETWTEGVDMIEELQRIIRHDEARHDAILRWYRYNPRSLRFIVSVNDEGHKRLGVTSILPLRAESYRSYKAGLMREFDFSEKDIVQDCDGGKSSWLCFQSFAVSSKFTRQVMERVHASFKEHVLQMALETRKPRIIAEIGTHAGLIEAKHFGMKFVGMSTDKRPIFELDLASETLLAN